MGQRARHAHLVQSDFHADPNAPQELLDEIDADLAEAPLRRKHSPQSFPRNIEGSRRLKRTVQTTVRECRHAVSRASNAGLTLYRNYSLACSCTYWWEALEFTGLARGTQWLAKIRVGGFWLPAPALSRIGTLESHWESHCTCYRDEIPETLTYLGLQWPRWKQERSELLEGQQQLGNTVIAKGRTFTLSAALATDGSLTDPQCSLVANKLTCYLLGGRSSGSDAHTGLVLSTPSFCSGCQAQIRIANRQQCIPCMITKERGSSQNSS